MRRNVLANLIVCNAIWSANPIAGKVLLEQHSPIEIAWLRCATTLTTAWLLLTILRWLKPAEVSTLKNSLNPRNLPWIAALGVISFFGSFILHTHGLSHSTATANALIIAIEPLVATLLAWLILREKIGISEGGAFVLAIFGFLLLSHLNPSTLFGEGSSFLLGNLLLLLSLFTDSTFSVISRRLSGQVAPVSIFAHALPFGFLLLTIYGAAKGTPFTGAFSLSFREWLALLWFGPVGTALTWAYWSIALRTTSVAAVSLTLFAQPILGAAAGYAFLGERLTIEQSAGACFILAALCLQTGFTIRRKQ